MSLLRLFRPFCLAAALSLPGLAVAETAFPDAFQALLAKGQTTEAAAFAKARLDQSPGDAQARFALGAAQFLARSRAWGRG